MAGTRAAALIALTLAAGVASAALAASRVQRRVKGTVERVVHAPGPCRGGVAVTREEMAEWQAQAQRSLLSQTTFTLFAGDKHVGKPVMRFKTDRAGRFDVLLPEGRFCVMAGEHAGVARANPAGQARAAPNPHVDADCLRDLELACDAVLRVRGESARDVRLTLDTFTRCPQPWAQPCYRGPAPP